MDILAPISIRLLLRLGAIVAPFHAASPANTRFAGDIFHAVQPLVVPRALHSVYARFVDPVRAVRHSDEHVITICGVIANAAALESTMV